jgi:nicotinamide-nucleotide amidase
MPGVPFEMKGMMTDVIIPKIKAEFNLPFIINKHIMTSGISESLLAQKLEHIEDQLPESISLAYLPSPAVVKLRLTGRGSDREKTESEINHFAEMIKAVLGNAVYGEDVVLLEEYIGRLLLQLYATLSTVESCTGGKIAHKITSIPGSSVYYMGSFVTYSYELKSLLLDVRPETLSTFGAVSPETVSEMLDGALKHLKTDFAIAVSGIAGPGGGTSDKPVGTVYIGIAGAGEKRIKKYFFNKNRDVNIEYTCMVALHELRLLLEEKIAQKAI